MTLSSEFAFEGFRLLKKKPWLFMAWGLAYVLLAVAISAAMIGPFIQLIDHAKSLEAGSQSGKPDIKTVLDFYAAFLPILALAAPLGLIVGAMFRAAVFRAILAPKDKGLFYFKLGGDELRQLVVMLAVSIISALLFLAVSLGAGLLIAATVAATSMLTSLAKGLIIALVSIVVVCAALFFIFTFMVRISLAGAQTFATKEIRIFESVNLTQGNAWNLFVGYFIIFVIAFGIGIVLSIVRLGATLSGVSAFSSMNTATLEAMAKGHMPADMSVFGLPLALVALYFIVQCIVGIVISASYYAASMAAYKELTAEEA